MGLPTNSGPLSSTTKEVNEQFQWESSLSYDISDSLFDKRGLGQRNAWREEELALKAWESTM